MKLQDKVAVITGGNSGIGLATARLFKEHGAHLVLFGRNRKTLDRAVQSLRDDVVAVEGDVQRLADLDRLFTTVSNAFGPIDVLVVNAGIAKFSPLPEATEELFDEVCGINFKGAYFTLQKALPFLQDGASVVLTATSGAIIGGGAMNSIYSATKAAVRSLASTLSAELLDRRIRINVLSPGLTETPILTRDIGLSSEARDRIAGTITDRIPMRRLGTPEEMANAMLYLASSDSSYCLGTELIVDGGLNQL